MLANEPNNSAKKTEDIIRFEMTNLYKLVFYQFPFVGQLVSLTLLIYFVIHGVKTKQALSYILTGPFALYGVLIFLCSIAATKIHHARYSTILTIDKEKKEFCSYIYDIKKEVIFRVDEIVEVGRGRDQYRFFLKNGTWVSWAIDEVSRQSLEAIIKSFGITIVNKYLW